METDEMTKKILDLQKGAFSSWYGVVAAMQDQAVSSMTTVLNQSDWMPDESRRMVLSWVNACKKGRDDVRELVEESFSGFEKVLVKPPKKAKTAKRTTAKVKPVAKTKSATKEKPVAQTKSAAAGKPVAITKSAAPIKPKEAVAVVRQAAVTPPTKPATEVKPAPANSLSDKDKAE